VTEADVADIIASALFVSLHSRRGGRPSSSSDSALGTALTDIALVARGSTSPFCGALVQFDKEVPLGGGGGAVARLALAFGTAGGAWEILCDAEAAGRSVGGELIKGVEALLNVIARYVFPCAPARRQRSVLTLYRLSSSDSKTRATLSALHPLQPRSPSALLTPLTLNL
jgi:hypothetical protein